MKLPKLILTDIDGVWTDGGMYYEDSGKELKKFNTSDSAGVLFCHNLKIPVGIITGENSEIVMRRAGKLKVDYVFLGEKNKLEVVRRLIQKLNIDMSDVAYIGDDINDILLLKEVGFSAAPNNSPYYVKKYCDIVLSRNGGEGVFREFVELILSKNGLLDDVINHVINNLHTFNQ